MNATSTLESEARPSANGDETTADEHAVRLLPILREYSQKCTELMRDILCASDKCKADSAFEHEFVPFVARVCIFDTLRTSAEPYAAAGAGLIDQALLSYENRRELLARVLEVEEHLRQIAAIITVALRRYKKLLPRFEKYIDDTGRGSSPLKKYLK